MQIKNRNCNLCTHQNIIKTGNTDTLVQLHGKLYSMEYGYGLALEAYVAEGFATF